MDLPTATVVGYAYKARAHVLSRVSDQSRRQEYTEIFQHHLVTRSLARTPTLDAKEEQAEGPNPASHPALLLNVRVSPFFS